MRLIVLIANQSCVSPRKHTREYRTEIRRIYGLPCGWHHFKAIYLNSQTSISVSNAFNLDNGGPQPPTVFNLHQFDCTVGKFGTRYTFISICIRKNAPTHRTMKSFVVSWTFSTPLIHLNWTYFIIDRITEKYCYIHVGAIAYNICTPFLANALPPLALSLAPHSNIRGNRKPFLIFPTLRWCSP